MLLSEGQMSDYKGAALMLGLLPRAKTMLGDRGYDADWFRNALMARGITPCIPSKINRKIQIPHNRLLYRQRHKIENMFGKLKDWRRIHTRYDRCAHTFFSAICIAAVVIFWINQ
jgi:transposase